MLDVNEAGRVVSAVQWTEQAREDVRAAVGRETADYGPEVARAVLTALAPHVAALVRTERAAALREAATGRTGAIL